MPATVPAVSAGVFDGFLAAIFRVASNVSVPSFTSIGRSKSPSLNVVGGVTRMVVPSVETDQPVGKAAPLLDTVTPSGRVIPSTDCADVDFSKSIG